MKEMNTFYSQANQDEFVFNILNKQTDGIFLDIGSNDPFYWNNTYFLEKLGWRGICIDINHYDYSSRNCKFINKNALEIDYNELFKENNFPDVIDYLSIDIDSLSFNCLEKIPFLYYKFKVLTIEHDAYRCGNEQRKSQRDLLFRNGYYLICSDVTCLSLNSDQYFEDWWVFESNIDKDLIEKVKCDKLRCDFIVKNFYL